jgi:hypothetical protein
VDLEGVEDGFPAPGTGAEVAASLVADVAGAETQELEGGFVGGEMPPGLGDLGAGS